MLEDPKDTKSDQQNKSISLSGLEMQSVGSHRPKIFTFIKAGRTALDLMQDAKDQIDGFDTSRSNWTIFIQDNQLKLEEYHHRYLECSDTAHKLSRTMDNLDVKLDLLESDMVNVLQSCKDLCSELQNPDTVDSQKSNSSWMNAVKSFLIWTERAGVFKLGEFERELNELSANVKEIELVITKQLQDYAKSSGTPIRSLSTTPIAHLKEVGLYGFASRFFELKRELSVLDELKKDYHSSLAIESEYIEESHSLKAREVYFLRNVEEMNDTISRSQTVLASQYTNERRSSLVEDYIVKFSDFHSLLTSLESMAGLSNTELEEFDCLKAAERFKVVCATLDLEYGLNLAGFDIITKPSLS